ncbi:MAG TPA: sugar phosphate isomerase/epimerase [Myxococcota bacterium]|nr:sugar phosphate isomerase/epimerase [Myxococcota bacterium]
MLAASRDSSPKSVDRDHIDWVLWAGTVGMESPVAARVEAARANGYRAVSIGPLDVAREASNGRSAKDLGRSIRDAGLEIVMDPLIGWCSDAPLPGRFAEVSFEEQLRMCEALQVSGMGVFGPFREGEATQGELVRKFAALCDRAADLGARVHFEFMPLTVVRDVAAAWAIVEGADRANGGLVFDTWHFYRGNPDFSALARVPGDRIFAVQVADAAAEVHGNLAQDTFERRMPGDGAFDLVGAMRALDRIGALRVVGPEVISPKTAAMPAVEAARLGRARVEDLVKAARSRS